MEQIRRRKAYWGVWRLLAVSVATSILLANALLLLWVLTAQLFSHPVLWLVTVAAMTAAGMLIVQIVSAGDEKPDTTEPTKL